jgi:hypothetical protein
MTVSSIEAARNWSGLTAVASDEEPLGRITDRYLDRGQPPRGPWNAVTLVPSPALLGRNGPPIFPIS